jgi:hypothetical protein
MYQSLELKREREVPPFRLRFNHDENVRLSSIRLKSLQKLRAVNVHSARMSATASCVRDPRIHAIRSPSGETLNEKMRSDVKSVTCFGARPSVGCAQMFSAPSRLSM